MKVKLKCTWHCGRRSSQQDPVCVRRTTSSKAEHSELRGDDSSPQTPKTKTWDRISVSRLYVQSFLSSQLVLLQVKGWTMRGSISLSVYPPPFPPSPSLPRVALWLQCSQRGRNPRVSSFHFLGKSEPLPSIQPDTELFKDGWTLTHKTRRTH